MAGQARYEGVKAFNACAMLFLHETQSLITAAHDVKAIAQVADADFFIGTDNRRLDQFAEHIVDLHLAVGLQAFDVYTLASWVGINGKTNVLAFFHTFGLNDTHVGDVPAMGIFSLV